MNVTKNITLDFGRNSNGITVSAKQGDSKSRFVKITPVFEGQPWTIPEGVTVFFATRKPDGKHIYNEQIIKDNTIIVELTDQTLVVAGKSVCTIVLQGSSGEILTTQNFTLDVEYSPGAYAEIESTDEVQSLYGIIAYINGKLERGEFDGKDAYEYALEGGYDGSEAEFYEDLGKLGTSGGSGGADLSNDIPLMNGEASPGVSKRASRADHIHPTDTTKMPAISEMVQDAISDESKIPFEEHLSKTMKYVTWKRILELANVAAYFYNASNDTPLMNGVASAGTAEKFSKSDHVHPADTSRMSSNIGTLEKLFSRGRTLENADKLIVGDSKDQISKYCTWAEIISEIGKYVDPKISDALEIAVVEAARAVCTEDGAIYATLPDDITEDAVLALRSDLLKYYTVSEINSIVAELQPEGDYLIPQDLAEHNTNKNAHNDIRLLIDGLTSRLNALADSDDSTLDQLSEIVAYIQANRGLIESVTTSKINVKDIVNNLITNIADKPLSAAQGVELKRLIDAITVPTKLSELAGDATHRTVTDAEKAAWDAKSNFSGKYSDLAGKPTKVSEFTNDAGYMTSFTESDPTVPAWAKASTKPSYTKSDVGLGNVDNVKQYSASNPPPYPVTSVNGKTGAVSLDTITITGVDENGTTHTWTVYGVKS